ncbi:putative FAD-linked oxidoreductase [Vibrio chagasii]|uniref:D-2-hydroxyglutarate dehydrogenase YdiJ n=1 Tax=Vibrio chagasii TaxID=170679 RepID=UPI00163E8779|nr:FAD-binding and (Fe-S)-binding domain-containing protein [Vibrio chagasii]CAH7032104.1 putative FAD-linked oxidoreductase [Vibrio chagasii]CAH7035321.1 putative FAD-linked oxidoreductase [Vibrio chagasii]CAH7235996.1 putative FAD-linked oxidoreductase [Vibrio chagasii]CAH7312330.1 putative FAD-linked oxidoreductase [Vibrio chagasii]CAH7321176.1 putative FAD-linked oxidoreductase [Vibrio chagasii]
MLPRLQLNADVDPVVVRFLDELKTAGFTGDIESQYSSRLAVATDNSVYQQLPQAVILPKTTHDVVLIGKVGSKSAYERVTFSPRGGGTGTNGQSLTKGVVVDLSRYMNQVLEINEKEGWVRVQSGIVKDQLNDAVRPYGYFFSPDLSTSNRATLGGMINTDASGQGSLKYGKTSDHVLSLQAVFADGSCLESDLSHGLPEEGEFAYHALAVTEAVCREKRTQILDKFPPLNRFLTGYDLKNAINDDDDSFDLTRVLCGAEGSLAFITEAKLNLTKIPKARTLVNVKYNTFDSALRNAPFMVEAKALSVETVDSRVLNLAKQDIVWHTVSDLLTDVPNKEMLGINMVEFAGQDEAEVEQQVQALTAKLETMVESEEAGVIGFQVCSDLASIGRIYNMRKKAVGLLGAAKGRAKPVAFAEDTCVPPENLADFISEFRVLLDSKELNYGMFGHVDAGVLHVRPALDLCDPMQEALMHEVSDEVVKLVAKYGGLMWGEHGKGFRSEYGPDFFGEELFTELRRVKAAFDPHNKMNPGKICTPLESDAELVKVTDTKRGFYDRQIDVQVRDSFKQAMECNGNGLCFNYDTSSPMCPSMKVTADRRHSPKGRAGLVREWLRQLTEQGVDILDLEQEALKDDTPVKTMVERVRNTMNKRHEYDFSHEVHEAMNGCLACKACASQCPIKVDVPSFRSRFLNIYYSRYQRPAKDYLVANIETMLPLMAKAPKVVNAALGQKWVQSATAKTVGYVDAPLMSVPTLKNRLASKELQLFDIQYLEGLSSEEKKQHVLIVQDPFTSFYDAEVVEDFVTLAQKLGKTPVLLPFKPNGKALHIKGFLSRFAREAKSTSDFLSMVADIGIPLVGVDPALVLCYRDEYVEILADKRGDFDVLTVHEWLLPSLGDYEARSASEEMWYLFSHCTEKTKMPNAEKEWGAIFQHFGAALTSVPVGCCGMAGTFGHEVDKLQMSKDIYGLSWKPRMQDLPKERCLATGYSCRSQVKRFEGEKLAHPLQALAQIL